MTGKYDKAMGGFGLLLDDWFHNSLIQINLTFIQKKRNLQYTTRNKQTKKNETSDECERTGDRICKALECSYE